MTTFVLVRHASHDLLGHALAGRTRDIPLNASGRDEAAALVARLAAYRADRVCTSPRLRARETIAPLLARVPMAHDIEPGLDEIDFGGWSGREFAELERDPQWRVWCEQRSAARPPRGETIRQVQERVIGAMRALRERHRDATLLLVSHGDVIKAALAHYLGVHLDHLERFDIAPASISVVVDATAWAQVKLVNATPEGPP